LNWTTRIWYDDRLVLAENYPMNPADQSLRDLSENGKARYFASAILIHSGELPFREWQKLVMEWNSDSVHIGGTNLAPAVYLFRIITDSSEQLKLTLFNLRDVFSRTIPELKQTARKL
jgi:urease accessory protein UreH